VDWVVLVVDQLKLEQLASHLIKVQCMVDLVGHLLVDLETLEVLEVSEVLVPVQVVISLTKISLILVVVSVVNWEIFMDRAEQLNLVPLLKL
jgi:hypothetical protein